MRPRSAAPRLPILAGVLPIAAGVATSCRGTPTAPDTAPAELLGARVPALAAPGAGFEVVGYFGRGACDVATPVVEQAVDGVRLALALRVEPTAQVCTAVLLRDSVVARVGPAASRPFTVRLRRRGAPDSVLVVRTP